MTNQTARFDVIDGAKGIGIILVVFGHAWRGAQSAGLFPATSAQSGADLFTTIDTLIYAFHMPLFFLLSGLLFLEALEKYSATSLIHGRVMRLLWPMALWTWIFFGLKLLAGSSANAPVNSADFPLVPLPPFEHLWFLWALFVIQTILVLVYKSSGARMSNLSLRWAAATGALALALINPYLSVPSLIWGPMVAHTPYFLLGIAAGAFLNWRPTALMTLIAGTCFMTLLWLVGGVQASVLHSLALLVFGWTLLVGTLYEGVVLRFFIVLGQGSMAIYLSHTIFSAAARIVMIKIDLHSLPLVLTVTTLVGLALPLIGTRLARNLRMTKLLGF